MGERQNGILEAAGSIPAGSTISMLLRSSVGREHPAHNREVVGSSPTAATIFPVAGIEKRPSHRAHNPTRKRSGLNSHTRYQFCSGNSVGRVAALQAASRGFEPHPEYHLRSRRLIGFGYLPFKQESTGSIPVGSTTLEEQAGVAQRTERWFSKPKVAGSSPVAGSFASGPVAECMRHPRPKRTHGSWNLPGPSILRLDDQLSHARFGEAHMNTRVLLLNADYAPLKTISWMRAVHQILDHKVASAEDVPGQFVRSPSFAMPWPSVVTLRRYALQRGRVKFSGRNVLVRDAFTCSYCGVRPVLGYGRPDRAALTIDHVIPRAQSKDATVYSPWLKRRVSVTCWGNCVCACVHCNVTKADRTPWQAGMTLRVLPREPSQLDIARMSVLKARTIPEVWWAYLPADWRLFYAPEVSSLREAHHP